MSWRSVARNDLRVARSERGAWGLFGGFLLAFCGLALLLLQLDSPEFEGYLDLLTAGVGLLVPLAGIVLGYEAIVGEREAGRIVLSLSMPHSRTSLLVGKLIGRTLLFAAVVGGAAALTCLVLVPFYPSFSPWRYLGFVVVTVLYGGAFLWISVGLSMALSSSRRVIVAAFGAYIGLTLTWGASVDIVEAVLFRFRPTDPGDPETWVTLATFVGPNTSFTYLMARIADAGTVPPVAADSTAGFITPGVALCALLLWAGVPVAVGYSRFQRADL